MRRAELLHLHGLEARAYGVLLLLVALVAPLLDGAEDGEARPDVDEAHLLEELEAQVAQDLEGDLVLLEGRRPRLSSHTRMFVSGSM